MSLAILYTFRRCPYAMRARLAIAFAQQRVELREVVLGDKPVALITCSPKATVPVLQLPDGRIVDESLDIMLWALGSNATTACYKQQQAEQLALIAGNDHDFKFALDRYKYPNRYAAQFPEQSLLQIEQSYRQQAEYFISELEQRLSRQRFLFADKMTVADLAILPFVRQFAFVDKDWFDAAAYPYVQQWLEKFLQSALFIQVMQKYAPWHDGDEPVIITGL